MDKQFDYISEAKKVFDKEIKALEKTRDALGEDFEKILNLILSCEGKLILTGMGKPGHIATKMSATFASLGIPSFFMHPGEAMHGDLGMVEKKDVVMLDMKTAYDIPQLKKLTRTMTYDRQNAVVTIQDDVEFTSPQAFGTALVSFADIRQSATGQFIFKNNNETLHTSISSTDGPLLFNVTTLKTQISPKPRRLGIDFQSPVTRATITMVFTTK